MTDAEMRLLADSIKRNGLLQAIVLFEGQILDGRHRYEACQFLGVSPKFENYAGDNPREFVLTMNRDRRHLTPSQRALLAASLEQNSWGGDRKSLDTNQLQDQDAILHLDRKEAAQAMNVSERSVSKAKKVIDNAPKEIIESVRDGKITVSAAAALVKPKQSTLDATGYPIPDELIETWNRRNEVLGLMKSIAGIEAALQGAKSQNDPLFSAIHFTDVMSHLQAAHAELKASQLYAVCSSCQGRARKQCTHCKTRGFLSKLQWEMVPQEVKQLRKSA